MLEIASHITGCLLLAALLGFLIGYIAGKGSKRNATEKRDKTEATQNIHKKEHTANSRSKTERDIVTVTEKASDKSKIPTDTTAEKEMMPKLLDAPKDGKKDRLTRIKGIGPKIEKQLNEAGVYHFEQIANWSEEDIKWLEKNTSFAQRAKKDAWIEQSKMLMKE